MTKVVPVITIDGPSGSGKGTISRLLAEALGFHLLDSGALYRLTALAALEKGVDLNDETAVTSIAQNLNVVFAVTDGKPSIILDGSEVASRVREEGVGMGASVVAALPRVRQALLQRQRDFASMPGLIADGRDMGTVVFPDAKLKVFLTASAEERARRRVLQLQGAEQAAQYAVILEDIKARDLRDSSRKSAPLKAADDAIVLDSTELSIEEVVKEILHHFQARCS